MTVVARPTVKGSVGPMIALEGGPEIIGTIRVLGVCCLLRVVPRSPQIVIQQSRSKLVSHDGLYRGAADVDLTSIVMGCPVDGSSSDFGLKNGWHRLSFVLKRLFTQPNCGVFRAGICTIVSRTLLLS